MPSQAHQEFLELVGFVDQLIAIHGKLQQGKGRRHEQDAIHRAGVVMMVAAWESYVEKVVMEAVRALEASAGLSASSAGTATPAPAWAKHAFALRRAEIRKTVQRFNTPEATNVRDLMVDSLEFSPWPHWSWHVGPRQWDEKTMRTRLNEWVGIRHSVAHGSRLPNDVEWLKDPQGRPRLTLLLLRECRKFFVHLVAQTDASFGVFLQTQHATQTPW